MDLKKALPLVACLFFLALQGVVFRQRVDDPLSGWLTRPHQDSLMGYSPRNLPEANAAGPWHAMLAGRGGRDLQTAAVQGVPVVAAAQAAYDALVDPLSPEQQAALLVPQTDLVDPLFPGIDSSSQSVFFYCVGALTVRAGDAVATPGETGRARSSHLTLMPEALFWRLGRLAVEPSSSLTPVQSVRLLQGVRRLSERLDDYHALRGRLWSLAGLAPQEHQEGEAPPFPFPTPQEFRSAREVLRRLRLGSLPVGGPSTPSGPAVHPPKSRNP